MRAPSVALLLALVSCAHATPVASPRVTFPTDEARLSACLDLRDHIVDLYVDDYLAEHNASLSPLDHEAFTVGWREELAKRGTFDRFEQTCFAGLTPGKLRCGMAAKAPDALEACMKLDAR